MPIEDKHDSNIYQQLGQIQGSLSALVITVTTSFSKFSSDIADLRNEMVRIGKEQDMHRETLRKEIMLKLDRDIVPRLTRLEKTEDIEDGKKLEASRMAKSSGAIWGTVAVGLVELIKWLLSNITFK